jgi:molybdate transport system ATP-binding protein
MGDILNIENLSLRRGSFLLEGVSLDIREQEIFAVIGKTGAGKTLLLESMAGFAVPDSGRVLYRGTPVSDIPVWRRNIGCLYQDYSLFPHMTAWENIAYPLRVRKEPRGEIRSRVAGMAERFEISSILEQYPGTLSGGEQQRVALARALMMRPPLLLLDEPFSALDPVTKKRLYGMLREVREEFGCAIVFVTHDFEEARQLAQRVGVLIGGRLRGVAAAGELFSAAWDSDSRDFLGLEERK